MNLTLEWIDVVADRLRKEQPERYAHMPAEEIVFEDFCDVAKEFPKGDLSFADYENGVNVLYDLPDAKKVKPTPLMYLLASASLSNALSPRGIEPTWLAREYPTLPAEIHDALAVSLDGVDAAKVGELAVYALATR